MFYVSANASSEPVAASRGDDADVTQRAIVKTEFVDEEV